jgi:hypothetical protein
LSYQPRPLDTKSVELPAKLVALVEALAANNHEVWSQGRVDQGWRHGPHRDDELREHPGLVPYEDLPESEKVYDRNTVEQTLKAIVLLGYRITPPRK